VASVEGAAAHKTKAPLLRFDEENGTSALVVNLDPTLTALLREVRTFATGFPYCIGRMFPLQGAFQQK